MEFKKDYLDKLIGLPIDTSMLNNASTKSEITKIAFELYRETAMVAILISNLYAGRTEEANLFRNQAIQAGLIVRIAKFMGAILALQCDKVKEHGEVIMALNRCISESAINLKFFSEIATEEDFEKYVKSSFRPEKETYDYIKENIERRGTTLPIEERIIESINKTIINSGFHDITELENLPRREDFKSILNKMDMEQAYPLLQGIPSHAIHGTWMDLILHHLQKNEQGFSPKLTTFFPDASLLSPISVLILSAIKSYLLKNFSNNPDVVRALSNRIDDLSDRISKVDSLHEETLSKKV